MEGRSVAFESTHPFPFFDYFRIPYEVTSLDGADAPYAGWGLLRAEPVHGDATVGLRWPLASEGSGDRVAWLPWARYTMGTIRVFGRVVTDDALLASLPDPTEWKRSRSLVDERGRRVASVWRDAAGNVALPFDPAETMTGYWSERTVGYADGLSLRRLAIRLYYFLRPGLPRRLQIAVRRLLAPAQEAHSLLGWPIDAGLIDLYEWLFAELVRVAGRPVPWISPWPYAYTWALVLTHDVDTAVGAQRIALLRDVERAEGLCSSWNFVPMRYPIRDTTLRALVSEGCEVGVHGLRHDGKDLGSLRLLKSRLPAIRAYAERWEAVGFRSPGTQRRWEWLPMLGFEYDSSFPDTDPFEPLPGGCGTYLPYMNGHTVELPITLPQDHTLFTILRRPDEAVWLEKTRHIRDHGGMALALTHPDYADQKLVDAYRSLLSRFRDDPTVWHALPKDVGRWWRRRAGSCVVDRGGRWVVEGPARDEATVRLARGDGHALGPELRSNAEAGARLEREKAQCASR